MLHAHALSWYPWPRTGLYLKEKLLTSFCLCWKISSNSTRRGPGHMTIRIYYFEVDVPWGRIPMSALTRAPCFLTPKILMSPVLCEGLSTPLSDTPPPNMNQGVWSLEDIRTPSTSLNRESCL